MLERDEIPEYKVQCAHRLAPASDWFRVSGPRWDDQAIKNLILGSPVLFYLFFRSRKSNKLHLSDDFKDTTLTELVIASFSADLRHISPVSLRGRCHFRYRSRFRRSERTKKKPELNDCSTFQGHGDL